MLDELFDVKDNEYAIKQGLVSKNKNLSIFIFILFEFLGNI